MPSFDPAGLERLVARALGVAGASPDNALAVAHHLVESNLKGVDSHGVARLPRYLEMIDEGAIAPAARPEVTRDAAAFALVDGHRGFGMVALERATEIAIDKAKASGVATVGASL